MVGLGKYDLELKPLKLCCTPPARTSYKYLQMVMTSGPSVFNPILLSLAPVSLEEEEALLSEMDVTGQAFEDMQEQNSRLLQQLREKDDANFKLMSERIKSNQIYKLLKEEKEELADQVLTFKTQVMCDFYLFIYLFSPGKCNSDGFSSCGGSEVLTVLSLSRWMPSC